MPVQYRSFYLRKLSKNKDAERKEYEKASGKQEGASSSKVSKGPSIQRY